MSSPLPEPDPPAAATEGRLPRWLDRTLWTLVAFTMLAIPLVVAPGGFDPFRIPKNVLFQLMALAIFALLAVAILFVPRIAHGFASYRSPLLLALAGLVWTACTAMLSLRPTVSAYKVFSMFCVVVWLLAALLVVSHRRIAAVTIVLLPAVVNAALALGQSFGNWTMWYLPTQLGIRLRTTGLIGTVNELGGYLVLPLLAAIAAAVAWRRWRWAFACAAIAIALGLVSAQSVTSLAAAGAGLAAMMLLPGARKLRTVAAIGLLLLAAAVALHPGSRARIQTAFSFAAGGQLSEMTSFRLPAYAVAWQIFREHPLTGAGPGAFRSMYMSYKLELDARHPEWIRLGNQSFGQVHNDHLQLLAETGVPGYLIFLAALLLVARVSFRGNDDVPAARFATIFAFPAAIAFFVLALAHFPLQVASHVVPAIYLAALCLTWKPAA